ncbi:MAG: Ycf51 family protein [Gloeomargarita sp. SKYBB_i_bin120]|nr:Ycf51 family protein [Gloeomargarita sp. SKYB120]MDW8178571.1 Ycf51 family protein [Gloeomargarita sp. SKYBB_i_bin120]
MLAVTIPTPAEFAQAARWLGGLTLFMGVVTAVAFIAQWGIRFRLVGITAFMLVLTGGLFALGLTPVTRTVLPDAVRYTTVYDNGGTQAVIAVPRDITPTQLHATLQQAANDLFSYGRLAKGEPVLTIRARTLLHPEPGVTEPVYLGYVRRSLRQREDPAMVIELDTQALARVAANHSGS